MYMVVGALALASLSWAVLKRILKASKYMDLESKFVNMEEDEFRESVLRGKVNMDYAPARRKAREAFKHIQGSLNHPLFKMPSDGLKIDENYEINSRGIELFCKSWLPTSERVKGLICFCHGYGDSCPFFFEGVARKFANSGYAVFGMDYPGFGLSEGLHGYIPSFDKLVDDVIEHYSKIRGKPEYKGLPYYLYGQSLGGAVALNVHLKQPNAWNGAILNAPMCKMADDIVPPWPLIKLLSVAVYLFPGKKWTPCKDLEVLSCKDPVKKRMGIYNVVLYRHAPRLKTALELLKATFGVERQMHNVSLPLLILHGASYMVTDPFFSKLLYKRSASIEKELKLYENAYHAILEAESDDLVLSILEDIVSWLNAHSLAFPKCY